MTKAKSPEEYSRIFIATFFEHHAANLVKPLRCLDHETCCGLKQVPPEQIHLTWKFIGNFPAAQMQKLINEVDEVANSIKEISFNMKQSEVWPNKRRPRHLVITSDGKHTEAQDFFRILEEKLTKFKINKEARKFNPHITIARFRRNTCCNPLLLKAMDKFVPQGLPVTNIQIVQSDLSEKGANYRVLWERRHNFENK